jgi:hypothetical protein
MRSTNLVTRLQDEQLEHFIGSLSTRVSAHSSIAPMRELIEHAVALYRHRFVSAGMFENSVYTGIERALAALQAEKAQLYVSVASF